MLICPICELTQQTGAEHLKHMTLHRPQHMEIKYKCNVCNKTLSWNGYRSHLHVVDYVKLRNAQRYAPRSNDENDDMNFNDVAQRCFDKWKEVKGRANATNVFADEMFNFAKEMLTFLCEKVQGPHRYDQMLETSFDNIRSAYKRKMVVAKSSSFIKPVPYTITHRFERVFSHGDVVLKQRDNDMARIKPRKSLEQLLQKESHTFSHLVKDIGKDFIAVQIYADDFGSTNPLGYSATMGKMNAFYMRVLNLPLSLLSQENFIILLSLAYTNDVKNVFQTILNETLIPDFQELFDNGINLTINGNVKNFPVVIFNVVGDNLGVHQLFGYIESFNALSPCRMCKVSNATLKTINRINECITKTEREYDQLIISGDFDLMRRNGISSKCAFNNLSYLHILRLQCLDLMHDVLEGHAKWLMLEVVRTLPLEQLNEAWSLFPFKRNDKSNCNITFTKEQLKKEKDEQKNEKPKELTGLTSSMMLTLIRFLPLVVAESELVIKTDTPWWSIFVDFVHIMDILMAPSLTEEQLVDLETRVEAYLKRYQEAGGNVTVKSHFFLHYPDVIRGMGPLLWNWCMRYESAHRKHKQYSYVNRSHQNVALTYAEKHQHTQMNFYESLDKPDALQKQMQERDIVRYAPGIFVVIRVDEDGVPVFGCIKSYKKNVEMFEIIVYTTLSFNDARHCYAVKETEERTTVPPFVFVFPEVMELYSGKYLRLPHIV